VVETADTIQPRPNNGIPAATLEGGCHEGLATSAYSRRALDETPLLGTSVNKEPLARPLPLLCRFRAQPQGDVGRLHRLPNHPYEIVA
jgi:hypothetical protein